jgi:ATP-dependent Clp protease ATP-binding subunit ClpA
VVRPFDGASVPTWARSSAGVTAASGKLATGSLSVHYRGVYPFERFSADAKQALTLAQGEAERSNHSYIGTEHLIVGVLRVTDGLGVRVLAEVGVDLDAVRSRLATMRSQERIIIQQIIPTSRVKKVIELSFEEALRSGAAEVTTGHMVLGLLLEGEGTAAPILKERGATVDDVRELLAMLTEASDDAIGEPPRTIDTETVRRIVASAERDAAELGTRVVGSENVLRALINDDAFTAKVMERLGLDAVEVGRVLTPPREVQALSEAVQRARAEKLKAVWRETLE